MNWLIGQGLALVEADTAEEAAEIAVQRGLVRHPGTGWVTRFSVFPEDAAKDFSVTTPSPVVTPVSSLARLVGRVDRGDQ